MNESTAGATRATLAAGFAAALIFTSCSSSHRRASGPPTTRAAPTSITTTPAATTTTLDPTAAAVIQAYRNFWTNYIAVGAAPDPRDARLAQYATGDELQHLRSAFFAYQTAGELLRGTIDLAPVVVSTSSTTASLRDCYMSHIIGWDAKTQTPKGPGDRTRTLVAVTLVLDGGTFKVSALNHQGDGCTSAT